jgi:hypothetical protein
MNKIICLSWESYHRRTALIGDHLSAKVFFISNEYIKKMGLPFRYLLQIWKSWLVLIKECPDIIFVQNPPIFCVILVFLFSRLFDKKYVIDSHTGAFLSPKWRWSLGLHRFLSKHALTTIVHNTSQEPIVKAWGCRYLVIGFIPGNYPPGEYAPQKGQFNVAVVSSFREDEPLEQIFEAAKALPGVNFYISGDSKRLQPSMLSKVPGNCLLTGYLSYNQYIGLLRQSDAAMVLTTSDNTLLMGGFEAVSLEIPLIISDWPILREYFSSGSIYVANTAAGIREGVISAREKQASLRLEIRALREQLHSEWQRKFGELQQLLMI